MFDQLLSTHLTVRSTTETFATGTRKAIPVSFPFRAGMTFPTALAAPVAAGMMFWAAPRPSRHSWWKTKFSTPISHKTLSYQENICRLYLARGTINSFLGSGGGVDSGHETLHNLKVVMNDLGKRSQAVGGAGGVGNNLHGWLVSLKVDSTDKHGGISTGGRNDDLLGTTLQVSLKEINLKKQIMKVYLASFSTVEW